MDVLFHAGSAALLAYGLGERRPKLLALAGLVGVAPDMLWPVAQLCPGAWHAYTIPHSLLFNAGLCALLAATVTWRVAFGSLLHMAVDVLTHASGTKHMLYPFLNHQLFVGVSWWTGRGLLLWAALWAILLALAFALLRRPRAPRPTAAPADEPPKTSGGL